MKSARLCETVTGQTMAELRERRDRLTGADLVEMRLDTVRDPNAAAALAGRQRPVIVTCRPIWEGGHFRGSEEERKRILKEAQQLGADYIDIEHKAGFDDLIATRNGRGVIVSMHDFRGLPEDLHQRVATMRSTGAELIKVAASVGSLSDCLRLFRLGRASTTPILLIAMGEAGLASRVLATQFGSPWTYAGDGVAPGQISASHLTATFRFRQITGLTKVYGVVGRPVSHSLSPALHNAAFAAGGLDAVYLPFAASDFADFLTFADALRIEGASVTAPFKTEAFERATASDVISRRAKSTNTLRRKGDAWIACNTDVAGFLRPLERAIDVTGIRATIMGAGGAARAAAEALRTAGARVSISARDSSRAREAASLSDSAVAAWPPAAASWDLLVNATPVGTSPAVEESPLPAGPFTGQVVYDLVYNPTETRLLREARAAGCRTIGGLDMLVAQAELQFEWWTGMKPRDGVMQRAAEAALIPQFI